MTETLQIETPKLLVQLIPDTLAVCITDKGAGVEWRMRGPTDIDVMMEDAAKSRTWKSLPDFQSRMAWVSAKKDAILVNIPEAHLSLTVAFAREDEVRFEVAPLNEKDESHPRDVLWPRHFVMPTNADSYVVWALSQGELVYGNSKTRFHHPEGYSEQAMSWHGGFKDGAGYIAIADTPDDMYLAMWHDDETAGSTFLHWLPSHGRLRYSRRVVYRFAKGMDYRAMAGIYREHVKEKGLLVTLADKLIQNPNLARLIGGCVVNASAATRNFRDLSVRFTPFEETGKRIRRFREETGIENASVHLDGWGRFGYDNIHPDTLPPSPECGGAGGLKALSETVKGVGYLFGLHDQYIDNYQHAPSHEEKYFKIKENGRPDKVNSWNGGLCAHNCYTASRYFAKRNIFDGVTENYFRHNSPPVVDVCAPTAYYLDCFTRTVECFHPDHPLTRTENRQVQRDILAMVRTGNFGQSDPIVLQIEHIRDFAVPEADFSYGLGAFQADVEVVGGGHETECIGVPVPLWHLVFHDCVVLPHWGDGHLNFLYGNPPWFSVGESGGWDGIAEKELELKKRMMALHADVALEEMTGHELLEADGSVQRTEFAGVAVTVDTNSKTVKIEGGRADTQGEVSYQSE